MVVPHGRPIHLPPMDLWNRPTILFVTTCTAKRRAILATPHAHQALIRAWKRADGWRVGRYVVMPDHLHLFCSPAPENRWSLETWIGYWKRLVTRDLASCGLSRPIWQVDHWDRQLRSAESYDEKWRYVCANAERAGLVAEGERWPYQGEIDPLDW